MGSPIMPVPACAGWMYDRHVAPAMRPARSAVEQQLRTVGVHASKRGHGKGHTDEADVSHDERLARSVSAQSARSVPRSACAAAGGDDGL